VPNTPRAGRSAKVNAMASTGMACALATWRSVETCGELPRHARDGPHHMTQSLMLCSVSYLRGRLSAAAADLPARHKKGPPRGLITCSKCRMRSQAAQRMRCSSGDGTAVRYGWTCREAMVCALCIHAARPPVEPPPAIPQQSFLCKLMGGLLG
jgi:hypothetical protein